MPQRGATGPSPPAVSPPAKSNGTQHTMQRNADVTGWDVGMRSGPSDFDPVQLGGWSRVSPAARLRSSARRDRRGNAELLQHAQHVERAAELADPAVPNAIEDDAGYRHLLAGGRDALELAAVRAPPRPALS